MQPSNCYEGLECIGFSKLKTLFMCQFHCVVVSFCDLVERVLLPLAHKNMVHCDIQPGWDKAHNIMMTRTGEGIIAMRIIDCESLVSIEHARCLPADPHSFHLRYVMSRVKKNALSFLWWQCMIVAYSWLKKVDSKNIDSKVFVKDCRGGNIVKYFSGLSGDKTSKLILAADGGAISENTIKHHIRDILKPLFEP